MAVGGRWPRRPGPYVHKAKPVSCFTWLHASQMMPSFLPTPCDMDRRRTAYHKVDTNAPRTRGSLRSPCCGIKRVCRGWKVFLAEPSWAGRSEGAFHQHPSSGQPYWVRDVSPGKHACATFKGLKRQERPGNGRRDHPPATLQGKGSGGHHGQSSYEIRILYARGHFVVTPF